MSDGCADARQTNSCVLKLSKLTAASTVWRGFVGARLPEAFWTPNAQGVRGGVEYGFMSTSRRKEQALRYASGGQGTVLSMQMGMVDRGADIAWLSQYAHEEETLFPPLTGLELLRTAVAGDTLQVDARLSLNLQALTLEQVLSRRRKTVMDLCDNAMGELEHAVRAEQGGWAELEAAMPGAGAAASAFLRAWLRRVSGRAPDFYNDDAQLSAAVQEAVSAAGLVRRWPRGLHALRPSFTSTVEQLLARESVQLRNAAVGEGGGEAGGALLSGACALLVLSRSLTSLDLKHCAIGAMGGLALGEALKSNRGLTFLNLSQNSLGPRGVANLADALGSHARLAELNLRANGLLDEGVAALARGLRLNVGLIKLNLFWNGVSPAGGAAIHDALAPQLTAGQPPVAPDGVGLTIGPTAAPPEQRASARRAKRSGAGPQLHGAATPNAARASYAQQKYRPYSFIAVRQRYDTARAAWRAHARTFNRLEREAARIRAVLDDHAFPRPLQLKL